MNMLNVISILFVKCISWETNNQNSTLAIYNQQKRAFCYTSDTSAYSGLKFSNKIWCSIGLDVPLHFLIRLEVGAVNHSSRIMGLRATEQLVKDFEIIMKVVFIK